MRYNRFPRLYIRVIFVGDAIVVSGSMIRDSSLLSPTIAPMTSNTAIN